MRYLRDSLVMYDQQDQQYRKVKQLTQQQRRQHPYVVASSERSYGGD
ncbi:MAG: hypothetical protein P4L40_14875 [Terracidiphilus sp.]|nr:hypothetical protein [Terracidiphilus sp.]